MARWDNPHRTLTAEDAATDKPAETDALWYVACGGEREVFSAYASALAAQRAHTPPPRQRELAGPIWSSWYSWFEESSHDVIAGEIEPARELGYGTLDLSRPAAHDRLAETISEIAGWGVDMFKLDFIYAAAIEAERAEKMSREEA